MAPADTTEATARAPKPAKPPLAFMDNLNPFVSYFDPRPPVLAHPQAPPSPHLIIVFGWMDARDGHIAKYTSQYRKIFPSSRILLIRCTTTTWIRRGLRREKLKVALPILRDLAAAVGGADSQEPQFLVHMFSNGGVASAATLWELLASELGGEEHIPRFATFMDSCPGYWSYKRNLHVTALSLPGWAWPLAHVVVTLSYLLWLAWGKQGPWEINAGIINSPGFISREVRRTYAYGTNDRTVGWEDVEAHADQARERGANTRMEKFEGGTHVSQVRVDEDRYWITVKETWG